MVWLPRYDVAHIYNFKDLLDGFTETYPYIKPYKSTMIELFDLEFGYQNIIRYYFKEIELGDDDDFYATLYKKFNSYITLLYQDTDEIPDYILIER